MEETPLETLLRSDFASRRITGMKTRSSIVLLVTAVSSLAAFTASGHPSSGIVVDQQGNVFFSNMGRGVLKIDPQGKVTTVSKEGGHWLALLMRCGEPGHLVRLFQRPHTGHEQNRPG